MATPKSKIRLKFPKGRFYKLRSSRGVVRYLEDWAEEIAAKANQSYGGDGYRTSSVQGRRRPQGRWRTTVITADAEAMLDNARNDTLRRSLYG